MEDKSTRILREYIRLMKEFFIYKHVSNTFVCKSAELFASSHNQFWRSNIREYLDSIQRLPYKTYNAGSVPGTYSQTNMGEYLRGKYFFNPSMMFEKQALYSEHIFISDYAADQLRFIINNSPGTVVYDDEENMFLFQREPAYTGENVTRLCHNVHQLLDLQEWISEGIIKLLPDSYLIKMCTPKFYDKVESFVGLYKNNEEFKNIFSTLRKDYLGPDVIEFHGSDHGLFTLAESIRLQTEYDIIPLFTPAINLTLRACNELQAHLMPDVYAMNAFSCVQSKYLSNLRFSELLELRKSGILHEMRKFIRDQYVLSKQRLNSADPDPQQISSQFCIIVEDYISEADNEWEKIVGILSKRYKRDVIKQSLIFLGSVIGLGVSVYLDEVFIKAITALVGTTTLRDLVKSIMEDRPGKKIPELRDKLSKDNPFFIFMKSE